MALPETWGVWYSMGLRWNRRLLFNYVVKRNIFGGWARGS